MKQEALSRQEVWKMFDQISGRYDFLNHFLSFGADIYWRRQLIKHLPQKDEVNLLDLATGTGDQLIAILKRAKQVKSALGIDLSTEMILQGQKKIMGKANAHQITLMEGDAMDIDLKDETIDCITMSFGIRNVVSVDRTLKEALRVLKPGGRMLILEFSMPTSPIMRRAHRFYLRHLLPHIGGFISGNKEAYRYLNQTIETFPSGKDFCNVLEQHHFHCVRAIPLTFGVATLYIGEKAEC